MSATKPETREEFREYCLRRLGKPVIQINVENGQVEDLIDEALEFFHRNHYDGSMELYLPFEVTPDVKVTKAFPVDDSIISINRILETSIYGGSMFSIEWQMMAQAYPFALKGDGLLTYSMAMAYRETLKNVISGKSKSIRFNRHSEQLFIDVNWSQVKEGQVFVAECYRILDPEEFPRVWNDPFLKMYATALIKRQWGNNLRKLRNVQLVGGVTIDAEGILQEAETEIKELQEKVLAEYQEPINFLMG
jgi:hypothetical protein